MLVLATFAGYLFIIWQCVRIISAILKLVFNLNIPQSYQAFMVKVLPALDRQLHKVQRVIPPRLARLIAQVSALGLCAVAAVYSVGSGALFIEYGAQLAVTSSLMLMVCSVVLAYMALYLFAGFRRI